MRKEGTEHLVPAQEHDDECLQHELERPEVGERALPLCIDRRQRIEHLGARGKDDFQHLAELVHHRHDE